MKENLAKILIVDDDLDLLDSYSIILSSKYDVTLAKNGVEAINFSRKIHFNVALIDMVLADISGVELLKQLKSGFPKLRKIIITGHAALDNAISALNLGADAFMIKPVLPEALLKAIDDQLMGQKHDLSLIQEKVNEYYTSCSGEEREHLLNEFLSNVNFGLEIWSRKGGNGENFKLLFSNPKANNITGFSQQEKIGKSLEEVYSVFPAQDFPSLLTKALDSDKIKKMQIYFIKDLDKTKILLRLVPLNKEFIAIILEDLIV
jgi:ActR/RegA family two-component response regulator